MIHEGPYVPGPAGHAEMRRKDGDQWVLVLVRELRHAPEKVWEALTDPAHLREWAPFDVNANLNAPGTAVKLTWMNAPGPVDTPVTHADPPHLLEYGDIRWELEPNGAGTRLTLLAHIDRRYISWGAAGWHIALDVLNRLLDGTPVGRLAGGDVIKRDGWKRLTREYAQQFGLEAKE